MKLNDIRQGPGLSFRFTAYTVPKLGSGLPAVCACTRDGENKAQQKVSFFGGGEGGSNHRSVPSIISLAFTLSFNPSSISTRNGTLTCESLAGITLSCPHPKA